VDSSTSSVLPAHNSTEEYDLRSPGDDRQEYVEAPENQHRGARGAITGVLLGAGLWGAILVLAGVIKL